MSPALVLLDVLILVGLVYGIRVLALRFWEWWDERTHADLVAQHMLEKRVEAALHRRKYKEMTDAYRQADGHLLNPYIDFESTGDNSMESTPAPPNPNKDSHVAFFPRVEPEVGCPHDDYSTYGVYGDDIGLVHYHWTCDTCSASGSGKSPDAG